MDGEQGQVDGPQILGKLGEPAGLPALPLMKTVTSDEDNVSSLEVLYHKILVTIIDNTKNNLLTVPLLLNDDSRSMFFVSSMKEMLKTKGYGDGVITSV